MRPLIHRLLVTESEPFIRANMTPNGLLYCRVATPWVVRSDIFANENDNRNEKCLQNGDRMVEEESYENRIQEKEYIITV